MSIFRIVAIPVMLLCLMLDSIAQPYPERGVEQAGGGGNTGQLCEGQLLLDQQPDNSGVFSDFACDGCQLSDVQIVADNFTTALPQQLTELVIWGGYHPDSEPTSDNWVVSIRGVRVDDGLPSATVLAQPELISSRVQTGSVISAAGTSGMDEYRWNLKFSRPVIVAPGDYWLVIYGDSGNNNDDLLWEFGTESPVNGLISTVFSLQFPPVEYFPIGGNRQMALQICGLPQVPLAVPGISRIGLLMLALLLLAIAFVFFSRLGITAKCASDSARK